MSTNYHTPYPASMAYKTSLLNVPPGELDAQITTNVAAIAANTSDLKKTIHVLDTVNVDFSIGGETTLYTTISGEITIPVSAAVRAGGDAGSTQVTIGQSGEVTDFLNTQTLSNLNASGEVALLQPVPSATPVAVKQYYGGTEIRMNVAVADGNAINWVDLLGYII